MPIWFMMSWIWLWCRTQPQILGVSAGMLSSPRHRLSRTGIGYGSSRGEATLSKSFSEKAQAGDDNDICELMRDVRRSVHRGALHRSRASDGMKWRWPIGVDVVTEVVEAPL